MGYSLNRGLGYGLIDLDLVPALIEGAFCKLQSISQTRDTPYDICTNHKGKSQPQRSESDGRYWAKLKAAEGDAFLKNLVKKATNQTQLVLAT